MMLISSDAQNPLSCFGAASYTVARDASPKWSLEKMEWGKDEAQMPIY